MHNTYGRISLPDIAGNFGDELRSLGKNSSGQDVVELNFYTTKSGPYDDSQTVIVLQWRSPVQKINSVINSYGYKIVPTDKKDNNQNVIYKLIKNDNKCPAPGAEKYIKESQKKNKWGDLDRFNAEYQTID